jgi:hypothetical protein
MRFIVLAVVLTVVPAAPAAALECIAIPLETSMQFADIVLLGRIEAVQLRVPSPDGRVRRVVTVSVKALWKGALPAEIELHQPVIAGGINFEQEVGKDYVLFVRRFSPEQPLSPAVPGDFTSGFVAAECTSKPAATFDLKALGLSRPPLP